MNNFDMQQLNECRQELVNISRSINSSSLQSEMLKKEALKSALYAHTALSDWVIIKDIIQHPNGMAWIKYIARAFPEASVSFLNNEKLIELFASDRDGLEEITDIACAFPEASVSFFNNEKLIELFASDRFGIGWIADTARTSPEASVSFLNNEKLIELVAADPDGIEEIKRIACAFPEASVSFFNNEKLIKLFASNHAGIENIKDIACTFPEASVSFFNNKKLIELFASNLHGMHLIPIIVLSSSEGTNAFLFTEAWVEQMRNNDPRYVWINLIIKRALSNLQLFKLHMKQQLIKEVQLSNMVFVKVANLENRANIESIIENIEKLKKSVDCNLSLKRFSKNARKQFFFAPDQNFLNIMGIIFSERTISKNEGCKLFQLPTEITNSILEETMSYLDDCLYASVNVLKSDFEQDRSRLSL